MKKYISLPVILAVALLFGGCKKNDGFITEDYLKLLDPVPVVSVKIDPTGPQSISLTNLAGFTGKYIVSLYFPDQPPPAKVDIVIRKNGSNAVVKVLQAGLTTFPSTLTVTAAQLQTLFPGTLVLGDFFDIGADVYTAAGSKYETFPVTAIGMASGPVNMPLYSQFARFAALCPYDPDIYQGNFVVVSDLWADMSPGDILVLNKIDATHFSFKYNPFPEQGATGTLFNAVPIIVTVDPATLTPSIALQTVGTGWVYDNSQPVKVQTTTSTNNNLAPCAGTVSLNMNWTQGTGSYTGYVLKLKKQ